jgi:hypothetical protein
VQIAMVELDLQPWFQSALKHDLAQARAGDRFLRQRLELGTDEEEIAVLRHELGLDGDR